MPLGSSEAALAFNSSTPSIFLKEAKILKASKNRRYM
jgi:hypothetical protein